MQKKHILAVFHHVKDRIAVRPRPYFSEVSAFISRFHAGCSSPAMSPTICPPRFAVTLEDVVTLRLKLLVEDAHLVGELRLALLVLTSYLVASLGELAHLDVVHLLVLLEGGTALAEIVGSLAPWSMTASIDWS